MALNVSLKSHSTSRRIVLFMITLLIFSFNVFVPVSANNPDLSESSLLLQHNAIRGRNGLADLSINDSLNLSATSKAIEMLNNDCWSHYCPDGVSPWKFFGNAGYSYVFAGENLGEGFVNTTNIMNAWMNSQSHKENILRPEFTEIGFGIVNGYYQGKSNNTIVVVHFATPKNNVQILTNRIEITNPTDGQLLTNTPLRVEGTTEFAANFSIDLNGVKSDYDIESDFQLLIDGLVLGENTLEFSSTDPNTTIYPASLIVKYDASDVNNVLTAGITFDMKNNINLLFIVLIIGIFFADLYLMFKTNISNKESSLNHFHIGLFLILALVILSGGVFGSITSGISN